MLYLRGNLGCLDCVECGVRGGDFSPSSMDYTWMKSVFLPSPKSYRGTRWLKERLAFYSSLDMCWGIKSAEYCTVVLPSEHSRMWCMSTWESLKCGEKYDPGKMNNISGGENTKSGLGFIEQLVPVVLIGLVIYWPWEGRSSLWRQLYKTLVLPKLHRAWNLEEKN